MSIYILTFGTIRNASANDLLCVRVAKIVPRAGLADVRAERAEGLVAGQVEAGDFGVVEVEVLVALRIGAKSGVISQGREVNRSALCIRLASSNTGAKPS
jgi:hypothetical protein